ncbi:MAG: twin-arginine translocase TatA/TatE family subunit [Actinomycetota bacterium]|nr:twin-arginine translocase TatA/TatE family subunit [Actinomycetota bacterium]
MGIGGIGPLELIIVLVIALIVLGPKRLPEAGRSIGRGMREFKESLSGSRDDDDDVRTIPSVPTEASESVAGLPPRQPESVGGLPAHKSEASVHASSPSSPN